MISIQVREYKGYIVEIGIKMTKGNNIKEFRIYPMKMRMVSYFIMKYLFYILYIYNWPDNRSCLAHYKSISDLFECSSPRKSLVKSERFIQQFIQGTAQDIEALAKFERKLVANSKRRRRTTIPEDAHTCFRLFLELYDKKYL